MAWVQAKRVVQSVRSFEKNKLNVVYDTVLRKNVAKSLSTSDESWSESRCYAIPLSIFKTPDEETIINRCTSYQGVSLRGGLNYAEGMHLKANISGPHCRLAIVELTDFGILKMQTLSIFNHYSFGTPED